MKWLLIIAGLYSGLVLLVYFFQKHLLFFPDQTSFDECPSVTHLGGEVYQYDLARYYVVKTETPEPKGWLLHFHGNGGRTCDRLPLLKGALELGYHLVLAEYPGYSENASRPSQPQVLNSALAVFDEIKNKSQPIVLYGESLGTAVVTYIAAQRSNNIKALILQSPFTSTAEVGQHHYSFLPVKWLLRHPFQANKWAEEVQAPVFAFHGSQDKIIPISFGKKQFKNFSSGKKEFWEVPGAHHNDLLFYTQDRLWRKLSEFLRAI